MNERWLNTHEHGVYCKYSIGHKLILSNLLKIIFHFLCEATHIYRKQSLNQNIVIIFLLSETRN